MKKGKDGSLLNVWYFISEKKLVRFIWVSCYFSSKFFQLKNTVNKIIECSLNRKRKCFVSVYKTYSIFCLS